MDEIEVRVKVTPNPQLYGIKITKLIKQKCQEIT